MTDFDSNRWTLARELPEMRTDCVNIHGGERCSPDWHPIQYPQGDGTRSWMGILTETMGFKHHWWAGWDYTKNGFLCELSSKDGVVTATSLNADEALAAAAVKALEARHGGV